MWSCLSSFVYLIWIANMANIAAGIYCNDIQSCSYRRHVKRVAEYDFHYENDGYVHTNLFLTHGTLFTKSLPISVKVPARTRVELLCEAIGHPAPQIFWTRHRNGTYEAIAPVIEAFEAQEIGKNLSIVRSKLVIDRVIREDQGPLQCISVSGNRVKLSQTELKVIENGSMECDESENKLTITLHCPVVIAKVNSTATLPCRFTGKDIFDFFWIDEKGKTMGSTQQGRFTVLSNGDLQIKNLRPSDMNTYTCVVRSTFAERTASTYLYSLIDMKHDPVSNEIKIITGGKRADHVHRTLSIFFAPLMFI